MDPDRWRRLDALFQDALELPPERREGFLATACADDQELRREVAAMLAADATGPGGAEVTAGESDRLAGIVGSGAAQLGLDEDAGAADVEPLPFASLGAYRLIEEIGRGGLATVYLAERNDEQFSMRVAVKLIRRGFDTPDLLGRLRLERQILARLEHPNIARLIDGGTTPDGRPYFVMELIEGVRIDEWCRQQELDLRQRLELFRQVCDAVQTAHRQLVLHRDLKPSNILVTREGVPKLLDFGIAKMLVPPENGGSGEESGPLAPSLPTLTSTGMRLLTPEFASPEQVRGETLTTASDVYSLGVLLYLLVTGEPPYTFDRWRPTEVERVVCEREPSRPSTRVWPRDGADSSLPTRETLGWPRRVTGDDLDQVVLEALRKEPERRYGSVVGLAEDLRRYLDDLPVSARPDSMGYRVGKFVRRNRIPVVAGALLLVSLIVGVVATSWQASVARRAQRVAETQRELAEQRRLQAERERRRAEEAATFLVDLFEVSDPYRTPDEPITARELLDRGAVRIRVGLGEDPLLRATLLATIGRVYQNLALFPESEDLLSEALRLRHEAAGESSGDTQESRLDLARLWLDQERFQEAEEELERLVGQRRGGEARALSEALYELALARRGLDRPEDAEALLLEALALQKGPGVELEAAQTRNALGQLRRREGDFTTAKQELEAVLETRRRQLGEEHPLVISTLNDLALTLQQSGDLESAEELYREILEVQLRVFGERHHHIVTSIHNLARVLIDQGEIEAALPLCDQLEDAVRGLYGQEHPAMARALFLRAMAYRIDRRPADAVPLVRRALAIARRHFGPDHGSTLRHTNLLAQLLAELGDPEAETVLLDLITSLRRGSPPGDLRLSHPLQRLGILRLNKNEPRAAEPLFRESLEIRRGALPLGHWQTAQAEGQLGRCLIHLGLLEEAGALLASSLEALREAVGEEHPQTLAVLGYLEELANARAAARERVAAG